ncbi:MAG: Asp23/Gls24 family envelope stress response protein [Synergistaceae bacterium]|nr:Asp23/Gls24 family envelope stress response protein [Synergistaceae bacterium]
MDNNDEFENPAVEVEMPESHTVDQTGLEGKIRISEDVISQLAIKALASVEGIQPANPGLMANLRMGRKAANGVRIAISDGDAPKIQVDTYVSVKYSLRIPDVCWDVQEAVKDQIEKFTGYTVKSVNVYVQGITFNDKPAGPEEFPVGDNPAGVENI